MKRVLSLRGRLGLGAVLWTIGLFAAAVMISTWLVLRYPRYPIYLHGTAQHYAFGVTVLILVSTLVGFLQIRKALGPLDRLRERLADVHAGSQARLAGEYPSELQPLVDDLNALLAHRELAVQRAQGKAADLAHGLKTPLAVLAHEAQAADAAGHADLAHTLRQQIERMRRQIDYHLAHARAAASGARLGARCSVAESAEGLARTLQRLHAGRGLAIDVHVPADHAIRGQREDLDEMLGNLLDNACKWAKSRVVVASANGDGAVVITVDDDGPGIPPAMRHAVLQRGVRADEAAPGSGLGLAIVRDLADVYGGAVALDRSPLGGVRVELRLPAA
jgi:signal transduction histidine kinase